MAEVLTGVNGEIIKWARQRYNMSEENAASAIGVTLPRYLDWENGKDYPTYAMLKKISNVYHKPSALFFFPEPPKLPDIKAELRTLPNSVSDEFSKNVIRQFELAQVYQLNLKELYGSRATILSNIPASLSTISDLCQYIRKSINFTIDRQKSAKSDKVVFEVFREGLYDCGVYVFKDSFGDNDISGLCLYDKEFPVIMINNSMSFARQNFTLFHELFHLISNTSGAEIIRDYFYSHLNLDQANIEKRCDEFANEFLVPTEDFIKVINNKDLDEDTITNLAKTYSVSKEAIMYKLYTLGKISASTYNEMKEFFYGDALRQTKRNAEKKSGGNFYLTKISYLGQQYTGAVFKEYYSGKISSYKASEMLNSKIDHLSNLESAYFRGMK